MKLTLFNKITMKRIDVLDKDDFLITIILLYGDLALYEETNKFIITSIIKYILATKQTFWGSSCQSLLLVEKYYCH